MDHAIRFERVREGSGRASAERVMIVTDTLAGKRVVVTGASSGIGLATARLFAEEGAHVLGLAKQWPAIPEGIDHVTGDVTIEADVAMAVDRASGSDGLDIIVANAAILVPDDWQRGDPADWSDVLDVNLLGVMRSFRLAAANMIEHGRAGRLLATASTAGIRAFPDSPAYAASKAGVISVVQSAALAFAEHGITANAIAPGHINDTALHDAIVRRMAGAGGLTADAVEDDWRAPIPLGRFGRASEIAHAFLFLASDASAYITGATLGVDGGLPLSWGSAP